MVTEATKMEAEPGFTYNTIGIEPIKNDVPTRKAKRTRNMRF